MSHLRIFAAIVLLACAAPTLSAQGLPPGLPQTLPTPDQGRQLLATRPDLVAALRREIANSGLTPDQIRARLRAAGYPDNLLDDYLGPSDASGSSSSGVSSGSGGSGIVRGLLDSLPGDNILDAVAALGLTDSVDVGDLRAALRQRRDALATRDTSRASKLRALSDSLVIEEPIAPEDSMYTGMVVDSLGRLVPARRRYRIVRPAAYDSGTTIFGTNVFRGQTTQFDPNLAGPVDQNYQIGPGDRLVLIITGDAERSVTLDVTREGFVVIPGIGEVSVANLTMSQLETVLYSKLGRVYSGLRRDASATTHFSLNLARLHKNQVYVLGDVDQPGSYQITSAGTALTALYAAGGPSDNGSMRRIEIRRAGKLIDTLDLYDYLLHADASHDVHLQSGDVVFVPVHGARARVFGEVVRPGTYELRRGETMADLMREAGGFTAEASRQRLQVSRILPPRERDTTERARVVIDVTAGGNRGDPPPFPIEPGDVVQIFRVADRVGRQVVVHGDVMSPGVVGFVPGMKLSEAVRLAGGLKPDAYLDQVLISRLRPGDSVRTQLRGAFRDAAGRAGEDLPLSQDDEIRVFSSTEFRPAAYVAITGAVRRGGRYAYREGMTLRDLVLLAGGLDERASLQEAEIARLPRSREGGRLAVSQRVSLDSSYLLAAHTRRQPSTGSSVVQAGEARDVELQPYDNVLIMAQPDWERPRRVVVAGEVHSPGTYTLLTKDDRLSDVIQRAGGVTPAAYTDGIVFYRHQNHVGRVGVDLVHVLRDTSFRDNLLLQDGDSISLPSFDAVVEVKGAVNSPRGVSWVPGKNLDYYVHAAGGASKIGDVSHAYVTQPDGSVESVITHRLWPNDIPEPRPGSSVYVTERDQGDHVDPIARLSVIAQILGALVALAAVTRRP